MHDTAPVSGTFPTDEKLRLLGIGVQAVSLSPYRSGPAAPRSSIPGHDRCFTGMLFSPILSDSG